MRVYSNFVYERWFSSIEVNGENNIPEGEPVIFAPNHQNGLIDAMALLSSSPEPVVFWVRADLFKNPVVGFILRSLKMMPAYRLRNGFGNLKKNEESMQNSDDVLTHGRYLCLMPEGGQDEKRRLRPLVKGIFRSAFSAQEKITDGKWVKIIPVGIDYGNYDKSGRHLVVNFGKAINIKDYKVMHDENAPVALNNIKDELSKRMRPLMLDIQSEEHYQTFYTASYLYAFPMLEEMNCSDNETNRLAARKKVVELLDKAENDARCADLIEELTKTCSAWDEKHPDTAFSARIQEEEDKVDANLVTQILYLIITSPLFVYSVVINGLVYLLCKKMGKKAHAGFEASLKWGSAGIFFPLLYVVETVVFAHFSPNTLSTVLFALTLPFSFFFFQRYRWKFQYVKERVKNIVNKYEEPSRVVAIVGRIKSIIEQ